MIWCRFRAESGGKFNFKFDDLNWVREGSVAGFVGGAFLRSGGARGPGKALKKEGAKPQAPGAGQTSKRHPQKSGQIAFRYPV
jgi:hypothetical protein